MLLVHTKPMYKSNITVVVILLDWNSEFMYVLNTFTFITFWLCLCIFVTQHSSKLHTCKTWHTLLVLVQFTCKELLYFLSYVAFHFALLLVSFIPSHILPPHSLFPHHTEPISFLPRQRPPSELLFLQNHRIPFSSLCLLCLPYLFFYSILLSLILLLTSISPRVFLQYVFHKEFRWHGNKHAQRTNILHKSDCTQNPAHSLKRIQLFFFSFIV